MKRIVLFDTSQGTLNSGDFIIRKCLDEEMKFLFENQLIVRYSTHLPISRFYQKLKKIKFIKLVIMRITSFYVVQIYLK